MIIENPKEDNLKVIITTRVGKDTESIKNAISQVESSSNTEYIRLLPFFEPQVDDFFFKRYRVIGNITYDRATRFLYWNKYEIRKPLFAWMMALIYAAQRQIITPREADQQHQHISNTLIYFDFIHKVIRNEENKKELRYVERKMMR